MKHTILGVAFAAALAVPAYANDYMIMAPAAPGGTDCPQAAAIVARFQTSEPLGSQAHG